VWGIGDAARTAPADRRADVSVLLLSWNTLDFTLRCLESIPASVVDADVRYETIVVDNGSRDGSDSVLASRDDIVLIANPENVGYAAAVNQAYRRASGEFVLLLNSDIEFDPGSLSTLVAFLRERPDVAGVSPLYLNPDRTPQQHYFRLPTFAMMLGNASRLLTRLPPLARAVRSYRMLDDDFSRPRPVEQPSASCLLLRRSCLPADELMDEGYPVYFNDVALCHSFALAGHALWMTPDAEVVHEHGASTRLLGGALARQHIGSNVRYLKATQPRHRVALYQAIVLAQKLVTLVLRRSDRLSPGDLLHALCGDPGPVPRAPVGGEASATRACATERAARA
jgi:GT2 family glycosyltransferase